MAMIRRASPFLSPSSSSSPPLSPLLLRALFRSALPGLAIAMASAPLSADPAALAEAARCGMCHHAEEPRLGPSWAAISERYAGDDGAAAKLKARVRAGGSGEWGKAPMPPVSEGQLSDADLDAVLAWILNS
jgi:cytochrome c